MKVSNIEETEHSELKQGLNWVICGGESGNNPRSMNLDWVRSIRDQCKLAGVPFFLKQLSKADFKNFKDRDSFPLDLRINEFPINK
jgi:protein gp37